MVVIHLSDGRVVPVKDGATVQRGTFFPDTSLPSVDVMNAANTRIAAFDANIVNGYEIQ